MTRTLRLKDLESAAANNSEQPFFTTKASGRSGVRGDNPVSDYIPVGILFEEHFDDQPDWTSTMHSTESSQEAARGEILPDNWDKIYQGTKWSPETGFPDNHASLEILASNADKSRGGTGKSAVFWRESYSRDWANWASDAQFIKELYDSYDEIYVEFWIRFSPNWWNRGLNSSSWSSKMFRVGSWSGEGSIYSGAGGQVGPRYIWSYKRDSYGVRNVLALMQGPHGATMGTTIGDPGSHNYTSQTAGKGKNGSDPQVPNLVDGGYLIDFDGRATTHEHVFGDTEVWTKMGFHLKLNSAPGEADGTLTQWINDEQFWHDDSIAWISGDPEINPEQKMEGWNYFAIGGNDYFQALPNEDRFEDWWALDDLVVRDTIPEHLAGEQHE